MKSAVGLSRFRVKLLGENFLLNLDGEPSRFGFRATRIVKAEDVEQAEKIAIIRVHQELNVSELKITDSADRPRISVQQIDKLGKLQLVRKKAVVGFDFYPEAEPFELQATAINH